jgi:pilus assembly protein Flp/PilA
MSLAQRFIADDSGASAAEYAMIIAIVGGAIAVAALALGGTIGTAMNARAECMATKGATCP